MKSFIHYFHSLHRRSHANNNNMSMSANKQSLINSMYTTPTKNKKNEVQICPATPRKKKIIVKESKIVETPKVTFVNRLEAIRSYGYNTRDSVNFLKKTKMPQNELDQAIGISKKEDPIDDNDFTQCLTKAEDDYLAERLGELYEKSQEEKEDSEDELIEEEPPKKKSKFSNPDDDNDFQEELKTTPRIVNRKKEMLLKKDLRLIGKGDSIKLDKSAGTEDDEEMDEIRRIEYEEEELGKDFIKGDSSIGTSDYDEDASIDDLVDDDEYEESFSDRDDENEKLRAENKILKKQLHQSHVVLRDAIDKQKSEFSNAETYKVLYEHKKEEVSMKSDIIVSLRNELNSLKKKIAQMLKSDVYKLTPGRSDANTIILDDEDEII